MRLFVSRLFVDRYFILRETSHITNHLQFQVINIDDDEGNNTSSDCCKLWQSYSQQAELSSVGPNMPNMIRKRKRKLEKTLKDDLMVTAMPIVENEAADTEKMLDAVSDPPSVVHEGGHDHMGLTTL